MLMFILLVFKEVALNHGWIGMVMTPMLQVQDLVMVTGQEVQPQQMMLRGETHMDKHQLTLQIHQLHQELLFLADHFQYCQHHLATHHQMVHGTIVVLHTVQASLSKE